MAGLKITMFHVGIFFLILLVFLIYYLRSMYWQNKVNVKFLKDSMKK